MSWWRLRNLSANFAPDGFLRSNDKKVCKSNLTFYRELQNCEKNLVKSKSSKNSAKDFPSKKFVNLQLVIPVLENRKGVSCFQIFPVYEFPLQHRSISKHNRILSCRIFSIRGNLPVSPASGCFAPLRRGRLHFGYRQFPLRSAPMACPGVKKATKFFWLPL